MSTAIAVTAPVTQAVETPEPKAGEAGLGIPEPGTVSDVEDTRKQPDPGQMHPPESNRQITLGGAQYFVQGDVLKIEGDRYLIRKDDSGEQVSLIVNKDTNVDCGAVPTTQDGTPSEAVVSERASPKEQAPKASPRQMEQGQRKDETARGAGFRVGDCAFHAGDRVKAEVDDMGRVTTLKYLVGKPAASPRAIGKSAGMGELALTQQEKPGRLDMTGAGGAVPKEYAVLPVPLGEFQATSSNILLHQPVKDLQGNPIGTLENFLMDTHTGQVEYAVIRLEGGTHLHPVPWSAITLNHGENGVVPFIDTAKYKLRPEVSLQDMKDLSPSVKQLVQEMEVLRAREPRKAPTREGLGITERPAAGGPHGEAAVGGAGPSGPRALPPGKAPGFEEEAKKAD
jgi:hypothetical protein